MEAASLIETLPERPNSLDEAYALVVALWHLVQDYREQLGLNSQNSSLPPSQDRLSGQARGRIPRRSSGQKRGAQPGHVQHTRERVPEADVDHPSSTYFRVSLYFSPTSATRSKRAAKPLICRSQRAKVGTTSTSTG